jgi:hypothetical protein
MNSLKRIFVFLFFLISSFCFGQKECIGTISSYSGKTLVVTLTDLKTVPAKNDSVKIAKDISGQSSPFGIKMTIQSGWMGIGEGVVSKVEKNKLTIRVTKETSSVVENGKKKEQFVAGKKVKIEF